MYAEFLRSFLLRAAILLLLIAGCVLFFDPFFHYHKPVAGLKAVATEKEYQVIGTIRNFDYDSVIAGSSVAENFNNGWFDKAFGCKSVKAIKSSGTTADLTYFIKEAYRYQELAYVFYSLDLFSLIADPNTNFLNQDMPLYLYNRNPFDDVNYLWNKDVLLEKIPYMAAVSYLEEYDEGNSYNWAQYKTFGREFTLSNFYREEKAEMKPSDYYLPQIRANLSSLKGLAEEHPETQFIFFVPPYSLLWWDNAYRSGDLECYFTALREMMESLTGLNNVSLYYFQNNREIVLDLEHYMDQVHFSPDINRFMVEQMAKGEAAVTTDNFESYLEDMEQLVQEIQKKHIPKYFAE